MVRWLRIGAGVALLGLSVAGCAAVPNGMTTASKSDDVVRELRSVRRDLATLKRAQARQAAASRHVRSEKLSELSARLARLNDQLAKQAELAGKAPAPSESDAVQQRQRRQQADMRIAMTRLTQALDRNDAQLKELAERIEETNRKISALQLQLPSRTPGNRVPTEKPQVKPSQDAQAATNPLGSANRLCATECAAGSASAPACHRCTSCAEQCVRREGGSPPALDACRNYCATR
ncbi:MAG: hypothetical protein ACR2PI_15955 [Hyphomicrobiaceae bacterium]